MGKKDNYSKNSFYSKILFYLKLWVIKNLSFKRFDKKVYSFWKKKVIKSSFCNTIRSILTIAFLVMLELAVKIIFFGYSFHPETLLKPLFIRFDNNHIITICTALISFTGIFLGLYASAVSTLFSQRYLNAPDNVAKSFYDDYSTSGMTELISRFITYNLFLIIISAVRIPVSLCFPFLACIPYSIFIIFSYFLYGHKDFKNSNPLVLAEHTQLQIEKLINCACSRKTFNRNSDFQAYYFVNTMNYVSILKSICDYAFSDESFLPEANSIVDFIVMNLKVLEYYESKKSQIPYNSLWYKKEISYSKWHKSDFINLLATTNNYFPINEFKQDNDWLEDSLEELNNICITKGNIDVGNYPQIDISTYLFLLIKNGETNHICKVLNQILVHHKNTIISNSTEDNMVLSEKLLIEIERISDYISQSSEIRDDFEKTLKAAEQSLLKGKSDNCITNNSKIYNYRIALLSEKKIYKVILTPQYYTQQILAEQYLNYFIGLANFINYLVSVYLPSIKRNLSSLNQNETVLFFVCYAGRLNTKIYKLIKTISKRIKEINQYQKEVTIPWPAFKESELLFNYDNYEANLISHVPTLAIHYLKDLKNNKYNLPDLAGAAFTFQAQTILETIETVNLKKFSIYIKGFFELASEYSDHIIEDFKDNSNDMSTYYIADSITSPIIEYGVVASFAMIIGQLTNNLQWERVVKQSFLKSINNLNLNSTSDFILRVVNMFIYKKNPKFSINIFSTRYSNWQRQFEKAVTELGLLNYKTNEFGHYTLDCGKDSWINSICYGYEGLGSVFYDRIYEPFVIKILNPLVKDEDRRYRSNYAWQ